MRTHDSRFLALVVVAACGSVDDSATEDLASHEEELASRYPAFRLPGAEKSVCWESSADPYPQERQWVREAIEQTWSREANITISGWKSCSQGSGLHIAINDDTNSFNDSFWGDWISLNFIFQISENSCLASPARRKYCIQKNAVHEFGHMLGFSHEQNRDDTPASCTAPRQGFDPEGAYFTPWDPKSVMNYCDQSYTNFTTRISGWDTEGVKHYYGDRGRWSWVAGSGNRCLDVTDASMSVGALIQTYLCKDGDYQSFEYIPATGTLRRKDTQLCLAVDPGTKRLVQSTCSYGATPQRFTLFDIPASEGGRGKIRGFPGKCLGFDPSGRPQSVWCDSSANQEWYIADLTYFSVNPYAVIYDNHGSCLSVGRYFDPKRGDWFDGPTRVPCSNNDPGQRWVRDTWYQLRSVAPNQPYANKCLDVRGGYDVNGEFVQLYPCNLQANQQWRPRVGAQLRGVGGKCLSVLNHTTTPSIGTDFCTESSVQGWVYEPNTGRIRGNTGTCLDAGTGAPGTRPTLSVCDSRASEMWYLLPGGAITTALGACLEVTGGNPDPMAAVQVNTCNGAASQRWSLSGELRNQGQCVDVAYGSGDNNAAVQSYMCNGTAAQRWDYRF